MVRTMLVMVFPVIVTIYMFQLLLSSILLYFCFLIKLFTHLGVVSLWPTIKTCLPTLFFKIASPTNGSELYLFTFIYCLLYDGFALFLILLYSLNIMT